MSHKHRCVYLFFLCYVPFFLGVHSDCGPPPSIPNTKEVNETSGTIVYTCDRDTGYYEIPDRSRTITCQDDGTWTKLDEFCTRACGIPEHLEYASPAGGAFLLDIFYPGQKVSYECRRGYRRVPGLKASITCMNDYTWSKADRFCELRSCGNPGEPENGQFEASGFTFGSRVTYKCNEGFSMKSSRPYRDCLADGTWSNIVPICEAVICTAPANPTNGDYEPQKDEYFYLDSVTFSCDKPFQLIGTSSIACTPNGTWSDTIPICKDVNCIDPVVRNSNRRSGFVGPYRLNSAISFECKPGFLLSGASLISCKSNNQWEPEVPKCLRFCSNPPDIPFALLEETVPKPSNYFEGVTVTYECRQGFERNKETNNSVTCVDGAWTSYAQFCSKISCGDLDTIPNGHVSYVDTLFGSKAYYTCKERHSVNTTKNYRECRADGTWSEAIGCTASCQEPVVSHAVITHIEPTTERSYVPGVKVKIECKKLYTLSPKPHGSNYLTCNREGQWEPALPACVLNIGIIIGITIGVLFLVVCLGFCFWKYLTRQKKRGKPQPDDLNVQYTSCNA